ncbi:MAG: ATP-binding protein, partial [Thermoanaerobaculia bacterium]
PRIRVGWRRDGDDPVCGDPVCGDPVCGDPVCGDPVCGDPVCGDPVCGDPVYFVADNGGGIEPQYQDKIFRLFERLDQDVDGTGIGLAMVKRIVEIHGGRIWVESEGDRRGSTFCFTLPFVDRAAAPTAG